MQQERTSPYGSVIDPILPHLPPLAVVRLSGVCRAWREQLGSMVLTERVCVTESAAAWLAKNLHRLRDLQLDGWMDLSTVNGLLRLSINDCFADKLPALGKCKHLQELSIVDCTAFTALPALRALSQLSRLELSRCWRLKRLPALPTTLVELKVTSCYGLESLPSLPLTLKDLEYGNGGGDGDDTVHDDFALPQGLTALTGLTRLKLNGCKAKTMPPVGTFPNLRVLDLSHCEVRELGGLSACSELTELSIAACVSAHHRDPIYFGVKLPPLTSLPALSSLSLGNYSEAADSERFPSLAGLSRLTRLSLDEIEDVDPGQLEPIAGLASLAELHVRWCTELKELPSLAPCGQLKLLHVEECWGLAALPDISGCTRLEELSIQGCHNVRELPSLAHMQHLRIVGSMAAPPELSCYPRLEQLSCNSCDFLQQFLSVASCGGQLKRLHIEDCRDLAALPDLCHACTRLEELSFCHCSVGELPSLASFARLKRIRIAYCNSLTDLPDLSSCTGLETVTFLRGKGKLSHVFRNSLQELRSRGVLTVCD